MRLIAHRGASGCAPENTMAAFRRALELGAKSMELDVHQTADRELAVIHDEDFKRVAGRAARVGRLSWKEARALDVGSWFDPRFSAEKVPSLSEVMDLLEGKAELNIEIKKGSSLYPGIEERVVALIRARRAWDWTAVSSFDHKALYAVRALDPRARIGYLQGLTSLKTAFREIEALKGESLNQSLRQVSPGKVRQAHDRGVKVLVYTVNKPEDAARLAKMGVDGIFTNFPDMKVESN